MYINSNLKKIRSKWRYSQEEFATIFKMKRSAYNHYEREGHKPTVEFLIKLQDLSQINIRDLFYKDLDEAEILDQPVFDQPYGSDKYDPKLRQYMENKIKEMEGILKEMQRVSGKED